MIKLLKLGIATNRKTRFHVSFVGLAGKIKAVWQYQFVFSVNRPNKKVKLGRLYFVLFIWGLSIVACSQEFISNIELTPVAITSPSVVKTPVPKSQPFEDKTAEPIVQTNQTNGEEISTQTPSLPILIPNHFTEEAELTPRSPILYHTQAGDSLSSIASRFNVPQGEIIPEETIPLHGFIKPGILLVIPNRINATGPGENLIPDSEVVNSPSTIGFDIDSFVDNGKGYLANYREYRSSGWHNGAAVIEIIARENSVNMRLLLALLEYQSQWVYGQPPDSDKTDYPIGWKDIKKKGLFDQMDWAISQLATGYYGWRSGTITELTFPDNSRLRIAPQLNAGTVALQYLFSRLYNPSDWYRALYDPDGFVSLHHRMFGDPWQRAQSFEPLLPPDLEQPPLELPFAPGHTWNFTGGPHPVWGADGALAALDFAPLGIENCGKSAEWVTASAPGLITRSANGLVMVDLDQDGFEQTGWNLLYLHISNEDRLAPGTRVNTNDRIGHPSCEGGHATGTHVHIARKYNGEWILADGPLPFNLSGWQAHNGKKPYEGTLSKNDQIIQANTYSSFETAITRPTLP